ncbi:MAG: Arsenate reductase [Cryomorphaceae bacterium]|nr:MAG: Arsenate reductase [Cryomorphaceae bacterium]
MNTKIYHNPRCSKSRQTLSLLEKETTDFKIIEYLENPLSFDEIEEIVEKLAIKPIDLVRKNEQIWKDNYKGKEMTDIEIIKAMERNPKLIERPIVINEKHGIIGRPPEKVLSLFA